MQFSTAINQSAAHRAHYVVSVTTTRVARTKQHRRLPTTEHVVRHGTRRKTSLPSTGTTKPRGRRPSPLPRAPRARLAIGTISPPRGCTGRGRMSGRTQWVRSRSTRKESGRSRLGCRCPPTMASQRKQSFMFLMRSLPSTSPGSTLSIRRRESCTFCHIQQHPIQPAHPLWSSFSRPRPRF